MDEKSKKVYSEYVEKITPTHNVWLQMLKAYIVGGIICVIGQGISEFSTAVLKVDMDTAATYTSLGLILLSVILTALNIFPRIVKFGGAGALVPITGFSNAGVSPAIEFKSEGWVLGLGAKMFVIAGPVIVYGVAASVVYGFIYWLCTMM